MLTIGKENMPADDRKAFTPNNTWDKTLSEYTAYRREFVNHYLSRVEAVLEEAETEADTLEGVVRNWYVSQKALYWGLAGLELAGKDRGIAWEIQTNAEAAFDRCESPIACLAYSYLAYEALNTDGLVLSNFIQ